METAWDDEFDTCDVCGMVLVDTTCPECDEEEKRRQPKRPKEFVKIDSKRHKKTHRRKVQDE